MGRYAIIHQTLPAIPYFLIDANCAEELNALWFDSVCSLSDVGVEGKIARSTGKFGS